MVKLRSRKLKERNKEIVLEGKRVIHEAIVAGVMPKKIFFSRASDLELLNLPQGTATYRIPYKTCKLWGDLTAPQGIIGIFQMPDEESLKSKVGSLPLTIICDNIRDPGNLGSIVRVVAGVGCEKLILTSGCTGVWEPKVVRAGAGAHFYFPIVKNCVWTNIEQMIDVNCAVFLADGNADCESADEERDTSFRNKYNISDEMELTPYFSVAFQNRKTVIILGGETHGLSVDAYKFAKRRNGTRIFIPVDNKIESLNNSVALGILAFEFKRQMWLLNQHQHSEEKGTDSGNDISK